MRTHVRPFIRQLQRDPGRLDLRVDEPDAKFTLSFTPGQRFASISHPSYDVAASKDRNPIGRRLRDKVRQFRGAPKDLPRGLIVCDGGCALMNRRPTFDGQTYTRKQIVDDALRQSRQIDFVLLLSAVRSREYELRNIDLKWSAEMVISPHAIGNRLDVRAVQALSAIFDRALKRLPIPTLDPLNASYRCVTSEIPTMIGGLQRSRSMIKISSRTLTQLLAGELPLERFLDAYDWADGGTGLRSNPFKQQLDRGCMIESIAVENDDRSDDDWLVIKFGNPDPAAAPFIARRTGIERGAKR